VASWRREREEERRWGGKREREKKIDKSAERGESKRGRRKSRGGMRWMGWR